MSASKTLSLNNTISERQLWNQSYDNYTVLAIYNPNFPVISFKTMLKMETIQAIFIENGTVPLIHVAPQFRKLSSTRCHTRSVIIDPKGAYEMRSFGIAWNELTDLPKNLNALIYLEQLYLHDNEIQYVDLAELKGLHFLELISLHGNKILEIGSSTREPIYLPKLGNIDAHSNRLTNINFEQWNATAVHIVNLSRNRLAMPLSFSATFPNLHEVWLSKNPLNCWWKDQVLKELKSRHVTIHDENTTTCDETSLKIDEMSNERLRNTFATIEKLNEVQHENDRLKKTLDANGVRILQLENKVNSLNNTINGLMELHGGQHEKSDTNFTLTMESKIRTVELRLRHNADALFGAWFFTSSGSCLRTDQAIMQPLVIFCSLLQIWKLFY